MELCQGPPCRLRPHHNDSAFLGCHPHPSLLWAQHHLAPARHGRPSLGPAHPQHLSSCLEHFQQKRMERPRSGIRPRCGSRDSRIRGNLLHLLHNHHFSYSSNFGMPTPSQCYNRLAKLMMTCHLRGTCHQQGCDDPAHLGRPQRNRFGNRMCRSCRLAVVASRSLVRSRRCHSCHCRIRVLRWERSAALELPNRAQLPRRCLSVLAWVLLIPLHRSSSIISSSSSSSSCCR
mmetsp:Transcript_85232/g.222013  ORF Transcript_85232/g.222013 Transcript_85232/m.222013 type:complete len:232 (-) Transcript_85232:438-1133(-)